MNLHSQGTTAMPRRFVFLLCALVGAMLLPSCATFRVQNPDGFAELDETDDYDFRTANAEGVVVAVRAMRNRPYANLAFWSRVVDERIQARGYVHEQTREVTTASGIHGVQFRYTRAYAGRDHRYWVTVMVVDHGPFRRNRVFVIEAGGDREVFDRAIPAIDRTIQGFRS